MSKAKPPFYGNMELIRFKVEVQTFEGTTESHDEKWGAVICALSTTEDISNRI